MQEDGASADDIGGDQLERRAAEVTGAPAGVYICDPLGDGPTWWERKGSALATALTLGLAAGLAVVLLALGTGMPVWERAAVAIGVGGAAAYLALMKLGGHW